MNAIKADNRLVVGTWNTLEAGADGAWSSDWGCPLEMERRVRMCGGSVENAAENGGVHGVSECSCDASDAGSDSQSGSEDGCVCSTEVKKDGERTVCLQQAQYRLTDERMRRIESYLLQPLDRNDGRWDPRHVRRLIDTYDLLFVQEVTPDMPWTVPNGKPFGSSRFIDCGRYDIQSKATANGREHPDGIPASGYSGSSSATPSQPTKTVFRPSIQRIWSKGEKLHWIKSMALSNPYVPGCVASFWAQDGSVLIAASIQGSPKSMRDDKQRPIALDHMLRDVLTVGNKIAPLASGLPLVNVLMCGDWNVELSIVHEWMLDSISNDEKVTVGMLNPHYQPNNGQLSSLSAAAAGDTKRESENLETDASSFSTNHESGFVAQYDGCILWSKHWAIVGEDDDQVSSDRNLRPTGDSPEYSGSHGGERVDNGHEGSNNSSSSSISSADAGDEASASDTISTLIGQDHTFHTKRDTQGFMPKGIDAKLTGLFEYVYPNASAVLSSSVATGVTQQPSVDIPVSDSFPAGVYYNRTWIPNSTAELGMSDHMLITSFITMKDSNASAMDNESATFLVHQMIVLMAGLFGGIYLLVQITNWQLYRVLRRDGGSRRSSATISRSVRYHEASQDEELYPLEVEMT